MRISSKAAQLRVTVLKNARRNKTREFRQMRFTKDINLRIFADLTNAECVRQHKISKRVGSRGRQKILYTDIVFCKDSEFG